MQSNRITLIQQREALKQRARRDLSLLKPKGDPVKTGFTVADEVQHKIDLKKKELTRGRLIKQLSKNGYGKYTIIETDMMVSKVFLTLNGSAKNILLLFLLKRKGWKFEKGKVPVSLKNDNLTMTWLELGAPPFNFHAGIINRGIKTLVSRGFIKIMHRGGACAKDRTIYAISENWRLWNPGADFSEKGKAIKRGFQGKGLGAVKKSKHLKSVAIHTHKKCSDKSNL